MPLLGPRIDFWSILGIPRGPENPPKEVTIIEEAQCWQQLWALQRIFIDFGSISYEIVAVGEDSFTLDKEFPYDVNGKTIFIRILSILKISF